MSGSPVQPLEFKLMFPQDGPDVGIGSLGITRSTITATDTPNLQNSQEVSWEIVCLPEARRNPRDESEIHEILIANADLRIRGRGWFLGVTAHANLHFRDKKWPIDIEDVDQANELSHRLGGWMAHPLYDLCLIEARRLIAGVGVGGRCRLEVPDQTPVPDFVELLPVEAEEPQESAD